jgi:hypothetical protein
MALFRLLYADVHRDSGHRDRAGAHKPVRWDLLMERFLSDSSMCAVREQEADGGRAYLRNLYHHGRVHWLAKLGMSRLH